MMIKLLTPERGVDVHGSGAYGAGRGSRTHTGIDFSAQPGSKVYSLVIGKVVKLGIVYSDTANYRHVEVEDGNGYKISCFYVKPSVKVGDDVDTDTVIGIVQDIGLRYKDITPHIHLRVKTPEGERINPRDYLS